MAKGFFHCSVVPRRKTKNTAGPVDVAEQSFDEVDSFHSEAKLRTKRFPTQSEVADVPRRR